MAKILGQDLFTKEEFEQFKIQEFESFKEHSLDKLEDLSKECKKATYLAIFSIVLSLTSIVLSSVSIFDVLK